MYIYIQFHLLTFDYINFMHTQNNHHTNFTPVTNIFKFIISVIGFNLSKYIKHGK